MKNEVTPLENPWEEYEMLLRNFLTPRVDNQNDVDDLLQEILLKVHRRIGTLRETEKLHSWIFQVARNALIDWKRKPTTLEAQLSPEEVSPDDKLEDYERTRRGLAQCVEPLVLQLPAKYRDAVVAVDLQGASQRSLAKALGLTHSAAKSRVQRGRAMLRGLFQDCCTYEHDARGNVIGYQGKVDGSEPRSCC